MKMSSQPEKNLAKALKMSETAAKKMANIICLPELFKTLYFPQKEDPKNFSFSESIPGKTTEVFSRFAKNHKTVVIAPIFEERAHGLYHNSAVIIDIDGKISGKYRKMHIPHDPCFEEKYYFAPGDLGFQSIKTAYGNIGPLICWDQWYPEGARLTALAGAQILFYPTAIGWFKTDPQELRGELHDTWETIQRSHAIANGVFVCSVNRVGTEGKLIFWGASFIADPFGKILARASHDREEIVMASCDLRRIKQTRENWHFLRDRRIDAYKGLTKRFIDE